VTRAFTPEDWPGILAIEALCFPPCQRFTRRDYEEELLDQAYCLVEGDPVQGAIWVKDQSILSLGVLPEFQGYGIGRRLLTRALDKMMGLATLEVMVGNVPAIELYKSMGFNVAETLPDHYGPGNDGLSMIRYR
jgi:ribosomal protein S18 acetylase RimI-like enzyme